MLIAGVFIFGCSSTIQFSSVEEANKRFEGSSTTLLLKSGKEYRAQNIKVRRDSTVFLDHNTDSIRQFCTTDIYGFRDYDHIIGASDGLKLGGLISMPFGLIVMAIGDRYAVVAGLLIMVPTTIFGAIVGLLVGHQNIYTLPTNSVFMKDSITTQSINQLYSKEKRLRPNQALKLTVASWVH
jgi:hypothetical protein